MQPHFYYHLKLTVRVRSVMLKGKDGIRCICMCGAVLYVKNQERKGTINVQVLLKIQYLTQSLFLKIFWVMFQLNCFRRSLTFRPEDGGLKWCVLLCIHSSAGFMNWMNVCAVFCKTEFNGLHLCVQCSYTLISLSHRCAALKLHQRHSCFSVRRLCLTHLNMI